MNNTLDHTNAKQTLRIIPWGMLIIVIAICALAGFILLTGQMTFIVAAIFIAVLAFLLFFTEYVSCIYRQETRRVILHRIRIWRFQKIEIPVDDIHSISLVTSSSIDSSEPTYSVLFVLNDGNTIPLTNTSSSGKRKKEKTVRKLGEMVNAIGRQPVNLAFDGIVRVRKNGSSHGIPWSVEFVFKNSAVPVTRWQTPCRGIDGSFVLIIPASSSYRGKLPGGIVGKGVLKLYFKYLQVLDMDDYDLPGIERAEIHAGSSTGSERPYTVISSSPTQAAIWLDARRAHAIGQWMQNSPLQASRTEAQPHILLTPQNICLTFRSCFNSEQQINEITRFGLSLIE